MLNLHPHSAALDEDDDTLADELPNAETLLVAALALMTQHAQTDDAPDRLQIGRKLDSTLFYLAAHPGLSPAFRTVLGNLRAAWLGEPVSVQVQMDMAHPDAPLRTLH